VILHYDGSSWTEMDSGTGDLLVAVWGTSGSNVYAVGKLGTILHYDGTSWSQALSKSEWFLARIWGSSANDIYVGGLLSDRFLHYDGSSWESQTHPVSGDTPTYRIGEYIGVAAGGGRGYMAWCGNTTDGSSVPADQQVIFDQLDATVVDVEILASDLVPARIALERNLPNPFLASTTIAYVLPTQSHAHLALYDLQGRQVESLVNRVQGAGRHQVRWNARNSLGSPIASGVYFLRLSVGDEVVTRKIVLQR
jgi:hypothetical protein